MRFAKGFERPLENPRRGLQGQEERLERGREGLGNFPGISRNRSDHGEAERGSGIPQEYREIDQIMGSDL